MLDQLVEDLGRIAAGETPLAAWVWPESTGPDLIARVPRNQGVVHDGSLATDAALSLLGGFEPVLGVGYRLVLLAELEQPPDPDEWALACAGLFRSLPERIGMVFGCEANELSLPPGNEFLELTGQLESGEPGVTGLDNDAPQVDDKLGIDPHHLTLAKFLLHERTGPLTMAIEAPWGRGKSSFMAFLEQDLIGLAHERRNAPQTEDEPAANDGPAKRSSAHEVIILRFNAWRYKHAEQLWAGLAHQVFHDLRARLPRRSRLALPLAYGWRHRGRDLVALLSLLALAVALSIAALLLGIGLDESVEGSVLGIGSLIAFVALVSRSAKLSKPAVDWLASYAQMPDYASGRGRQHEVIDDLEFVCGAIRRHHPSCRIILFVDDLDRCSDEHIVELLSAVHLVLGASDFYVILGVDTRMIYRAIASITSTPAADGPGEREDIPGDYLRKIVQVSYRLPRLPPRERFRLAKAMFSPKSQRVFERLEHAGGIRRGAPAEEQEPRAGNGRAVGQPTASLIGTFAVRREIMVTPPAEPPNPLEDTAVELEAYRDFAPLLPENPRQLKRLVNAHRTVKVMFEARSADWQREDQRTLVLWLCAAMRWPEAIGSALDPASRRDSELIKWATSDSIDLLNWLATSGLLPANEAGMLTDLPRESDDRLVGTDAETRHLREKLVRCGLLEDQLPGLATTPVTRRPAASLNERVMEKLSLHASGSPATSEPAQSERDTPVQSTRA